MPCTVSTLLQHIIAAYSAQPQHSSYHHVNTCFYPMTWSSHWINHIAMHVYACTSGDFDGEYYWWYDCDEWQLRDSTRWYTMRWTPWWGKRYISMIWYGNVISSCCESRAGPTDQQMAMDKRCVMKDCIKECLSLWFVAWRFPLCCVRWNCRLALCSKLYLRYLLY